MPTWLALWQVLSHAGYLSIVPKPGRRLTPRLPVLPEQYLGSLVLLF